MKNTRTFFVTLSMFIVVICMMVHPVLAATAQNLIIHQIESSVNEDGDSYTVDVLLSALNEAQEPIAGLAERDFVISEDDQPVEVDSVEVLQGMPISVFVVMDISGSMQGERLQSARFAISQFIKSLYRGDRVAVYTFNNELAEIIALTEDLNEAQNSFESATIYAGGGTCLFDAVFAAVERASELAPGRQAVVVLSDGWDTTNGSDTCSTKTVENIIDLSAGGGHQTPIYTIGIGGDIDRKSLDTISSETGGVFTQSNLNTDLPTLFEQLANRLSSQYRLSYLSQNTPGQHNLSIRVGGLSVEKAFTLPGLPPVISVAYPEEGQILEPGVNKIKLSLVERGIGIDTLTFKINGVPIGAGGQISQPPYEYDIDFSQYSGQVVEMTILALDKGGQIVSETNVAMNLTGAPIETGGDPVEDTQETGSTSTASACPNGMICIGSLQVTRNQLILVVAILVVAVVAIGLIVLFARKKKPKEKQPEKKASLFDEATLDGFSLPSQKMGRLTVLSSDDPMNVGKEYQLTKSPSVIGRSVNNEIAFPKDSAVSRQHIQIIDRNGQVILQEILKTLSDGTQQPPTYGTYVNDRKVSGEIVLHTGDEISLGRRTKLRYEGERSVDSEAASEDVTMDQINLSHFNDIDDATLDG